MGLTTAANLSILRGSGCEWGSNYNSHTIYFKRVWMRVGLNNSSHFIYFQRVGGGGSADRTTAAVSYF